MTIKKRLFISNILMIVIPIVITLVINLLIFFILNIISQGELFESFTIGERRGSGPIHYFDIALPGVMIFAGVLTVLFLTNKFLTRFVIAKIKEPLDELSQGVRHISGGNLDHRIDYQNEDEFAPICHDFNNMAAQLQEMVYQKQKDEASRRELIAGISHDLRTPLTSIKAYLEGLEQGVAGDLETQKRYFETIKSKTNDLEYIINQLFLFSKLDIGEFPFVIEKIDIGRELSRFVSSHEKEYGEKGLRVSIARNVEGVYTEADIVQLRNVLHNILGNSVKYRVGDNAECKISCHEENGNVVLSISDNGPGVPHESLQSVFEVFFRNDASRNNPSKGSGLGLAISRKIVERLKGRIQAKNIDTGGFSIIITLPVSTPGRA